VEHLAEVEALHITLVMALAVILLVLVALGQLVVVVVEHLVDGHHLEHLLVEMVGLDFSLVVLALL
jgi:hypothetical protein